MLKTEPTPEQITSQQDHDRIMKQIGQRNRPNRILRMMMNAFEAYRQSRKLGWSRPWNKTGLMNFQSFRLDRQRDRALLDLGKQIINHSLEDIPETARQFANDLINDDKTLMGFVFVHELEENHRLFEGATLSLGRKQQKRFRDRLDIIVEAEIIDGASQGFSRLRIFIDPYRENSKAPLWTLSLENNLPEPAVKLFQQLGKLSKEWQDDTDKHWNHWTSDYIDYFGPRRHLIKNPCFYQQTKG